MSAGSKHPEAYQRGQRDCAVYYSEPNRGKPQKNNYPSNPYPKPDENLPWSQRFETEWHAYNAGWNNYF